MPAMHHLRLLGIDFSSAPSRRKPITVARGWRDGDAHGACVHLQRIDELPTLADFEALLREPGPWLAGCDFPFGLPRVFVEQQALGNDAAAVAAGLHARCASRAALRQLIDAWAAPRPAGAKLPHRATDAAPGQAVSTSPLQTRYVPVAFMYYEGLPRLLAAGLQLPGLHAGDPERVAVEAYPGLLAGELVGRRSYKNQATPDRLAVRAEMLAALQAGRTRLGLRLAIDECQAHALLADASGDRLDAVLCLVQAAWCAAQPGHGRPAASDPVEGWIATRGHR